MWRKEGNPLLENSFQPDDSKAAYNKLKNEAARTNHGGSRTWRGIQRPVTATTPTSSETLGDQPRTATEDKALMSLCAWEPRQLLKLCDAKLLPLEHEADPLSLPRQQNEATRRRQMFSKS